MTAEEGGFYSSLDAETKARRVAYYVWTPNEVKARWWKPPAPIYSPKSMASRPTLISSGAATCQRAADANRPSRGPLDDTSRAGGPARTASCGCRGP